MRGLVLEGGGTKGAYHMGVYKAILEEDIKVNGITGTSIGALNGAMIIQDDFELCMDLWKDLSYSMVIKANEDEIERLKDIKLDRNDFRFLGEKIKKVVQGGGLDITPFKKFIDENIDEDKIRKTNKDFGIVTFNLTDLKPIEIFLEDIPRGELKKYLLASSYLPIFKSEKLGGKTYLDGGFYDNLPFGMLEEKGYKDMILVRTNASGIVRKIDREKINPIVISPSEDLGSIFTFDYHIARKNIDMGYYDALKIFKGLLGKTYYIRPDKSEDYFFNLLSNLEEEKIKRIGELLNLKSIPHKRGLFEYIIPKLGSILGLPYSFTYEELLISILEKKAEEAEIERLNIYSFEELVDLIRSNEKLKEKHQNSIKVLDRFIEIADFSNIFYKEDTIEKIGDILFSKE